VALLGETPAVIVKAEAEAEVGVEAGVVIGEGGGVVVLEPVTGAVEVAQWAEVGAVEGPLVVDPAVVGGVTSGIWQENVRAVHSPSAQGGGGQDSRQVQR
jgi:hypothetical protein